MAQACSNEVRPLGVSAEMAIVAGERCAVWSVRGDFVASIYGERSDRNPATAGTAVERPDFVLVRVGDKLESVSGFDFLTVEASSECAINRGGGLRAFRVAEKRKAAHPSVGFAVKAERWERDEGEVWLLSPSAALSVAGNQLVGECRIIPRVRIFSDLASERAQW